MDDPTAAMTTLRIADTVPAPPIPSPTASNLMTIPAQVRLEIFGHAMRVGRGVAGAIRRDMIPSNQKRKINVSLFTVCRQVSQEAQQAFYTVKTIRLRFLDTSQLVELPEVRHLEYAGKAAMELCDRLSMPMATLHTAGSMLPEIQTITVSCEGPSLDKRTTMRSLFADGPAVIVRCIDLGLFEIAPDLDDSYYHGADVPSVKVHFVMPALGEVLAKAKQQVAKHRISEIMP